MARRRYKESRPGKNLSIPSSESPAPKRLFHITVGAVSEDPHKLDPANELRLLKAALLYGDKVKLCGLVSSVIFPLAQYKHLSDDEKLEAATSLLLEDLKSKNIDLTNVTNMLDIAKRLQGNRRLKEELKKTLPYKDFMELYRLDRELRKLLKNAVKQFGDVFDQMGDMAKTDQLETAIKAGLLVLHPIRGQRDEVVNEFFDVVSDAVLSGQTYPLFDDLAGAFVRAAIKENKLTLSELSRSRAKHIGLSADLLSRLPLFDAASVDEIIDIRKELEKPLIRFRSAMVDFSTEIESVAWDKEFPQECELIFYKKIEPVVLEIEEACKSNKRLTVYVDKFLDEKLIAGTSVLGVVVGSVGELPGFIAQFMPSGVGAAGVLATAGGIATILLKAEKEWREKNEGIEKNQLYLYYKAGDLLKQVR